MAKFLIIWMSLFIGFVNATEYSFTFVETDLINNNQTISVSPDKVLTQYQWLLLKDLPKQYKEIFQVSKKTDASSLVLLVKSSLRVQQSASVFNQNFYRNIDILSTLSGMKYSSTKQIDHYILSFSPIFFKRISAHAQIVFPNTQAQYEEFKKMSTPSFIAHQKAYNFSSELIQSDTISIFTQKGNFTEIDNISFAITSSKSIDGIYISVKKKWMIKKLIAQTKVMLDVFTQTQN